MARLAYAVYTPKKTPSEGRGSESIQTGHTLSQLVRHASEGETEGRKPGQGSKPYGNNVLCFSSSLLCLSDSPSNVAIIPPFRKKRSNRW